VTKQGGLEGVSRRRQPECPLASGALALSWIAETSQQQNPKFTTRPLRAKTRDGIATCSGNARARPCAAAAGVRRADRWAVYRPVTRSSLPAR
jgi:hypothetical protein